MVMREGKEREGKGRKRVRKRGRKEEEQQTYREDTQLGAPSAMTWCPHLSRPPDSGVLDYAFTSIFTVEILLKV